MDSFFDTPSSEDPEQPAQTSALDELKRRWQAEKACPELLAYDSDLVDDVKRSADDMEERASEAASDPRRTLHSHVLTMDLDRVRFVLRSYLRCRIGKIDKFFLQIFSEADLFSRLSDKEQAYCERCIKITQRHMEQSALGRMPDQYASMIKQADTSPQPDMIPQADLDTFVFCKATRLLQDVQLDPQAEDTVTLQPAELHVLHYRPVRELAVDGSLQLV